MCIRDRAQLAQAGVETVLFDKVMENPVREMVMELSLIHILYTLWNRAAPACGYAPMTPAQMDRAIFRNPHFDPSLAFVLEDGSLHGFGCAALGDDLPGGAQRGYLSCVVTDDATDAGFDLLLDGLEQAPVSYTHLVCWWTSAS